MTYFSRLTDIVTCNLSTLLRDAADPVAALDEILLEMEEGLNGARRSVRTATANADRLSGELAAARGQVESWKEAARRALRLGDEAEARASLARKQELEDVAAGLEQEYGSAVATRDHLETTLRALQARFTDAQRKRIELTGEAIPDPETPGNTLHIAPDARTQAIEDELAAMRRELEG